MKKLASILGTTIVGVGLLSCSPNKEPIKENYISNCFIHKSNTYCVKDLDNDGKFDVVKQIRGTGKFDFYSPGFETHPSNVRNSLVLTPVLRNAIENRLSSQEEVNYLLDKAFYERIN
jgi:hypothetical protein